MASEASTLPARPAPRGSRLGALWASAVGKKALMAVTGIVLFLYVLLHLAGNLQVFAGPERINRYARLLHAAPQLLWAARIVLLAAVLVHVVAGIQLQLASRVARPVPYATYRPADSSVASRTMIWSGLLILAFVVYHVLDLTVGVANPSFTEGDVYHNVLATFGRAVGALAYVIAMVGLGFHLWHGLYSMFQSLGVSNRRFTPTAQRFAAVVAVVLTLGFASIPVAVFLGVLR
jgi:succinate dehydrogenase / fumarate reductase cytochrome b subunit